MSALAILRKVLLAIDTGHNDILVLGRLLWVSRCVADILCAVTPRGHSMVTLQHYIKHSHCCSLDGQLFSRLDTVDKGGKASVPVSVSCHLLLVVALDHVPPPHTSVMNMSEGVVGSRSEVARAGHLEVCILEAGIELVILQPPAPVFVAQPVNFAVVLPVDEEAAPNKGRVMVAWVEVRGSNMIGTIMRELINQCRVERQQVHIMHGNIVTINTRLQKAHVEQRGTVEAQTVHLINDVYVMILALRCQETVDMRCKLQQFFKSIPEWDE